MGGAAVPVEAFALEESAAESAAPTPESRLACEPAARRPDGSSAFYDRAGPLLATFGPYRQVANKVAAYAQGGGGKTEQERQDGRGVSEPSGEALHGRIVATGACPPRRVASVGERRRSAGGVSMAPISEILRDNVEATIRTYLGPRRRSYSRARASTCCSSWSMGAASQSGSGVVTERVSPCQASP